MSDDSLLLRKGSVFLSAALYWIGVYVRIILIRKHTGKSPNIKPQGFRERLLWIGWLLVVLGWIGQPFIIQADKHLSFFSLITCLVHPSGILTGLLLLLFGHGGTYWCYRAMGDSWNIWINRSERTTLVKQGPYRFIRHPIYLFQIILLLGMCFLLPTPLSFMIIFLDLVLVATKALDEEDYLKHLHGSEYLDYISRTGMFLPRFETLLRMRSPKRD